MKEESAWKAHFQPKRKMDWRKVRDREAEQKEALREKFRVMRRETEERHPEWFRP